MSDDRFQVRETTYYDVVDTEHDDQVVIRHAKKGEASSDAATLEKDPQAELQHGNAATRVDKAVLPE